MLGFYVLELTVQKFYTSWQKKLPRDIIDGQIYEWMDCWVLDFGNFNLTIIVCSLKMKQNKDV